jgi:uncharacterized membrane protein
VPGTGPSFLIPAAKLDGMRSLRPVGDRRLAVLSALVGLSLLVVTMVAVRVTYTGSSDYTNLVWNLFLAWVPLGFALVVYDGARRGVRRLWLVTFAGLWLLFFPNAPYLMTDLKYLREVRGAPFWYDFVLASSAALAGLALGFVSLFLIHSVARRHLGAVRAWIGVWAVLALSSVGVFLGRFRRFNSWDVFTDPKPILGALAKGLSDPLDYPKVVAVTVVFSGFLVGTYLVFYALARRTVSPSDDSRSTY